MDTSTKVTIGEDPKTTARRKAAAKIAEIIAEQQVSFDEMCVIFQLAQGMMICAMGTAQKGLIKDANEKTGDDSEKKLSIDVKPSFSDTTNRLLNAFPRPDALNEIYSTGDVDHRGVPVNYSIWRGNHSIMGMTGILFQKGTPGDFQDPEEQEGVEDIDLLEMVHDRLLHLRDYVASGEWIIQAIIAVETAISSIREYQNFCRDIGDAGGC
jgi:hypothetical protein